MTDDDRYYLMFDEIVDLKNENKQLRIENEQLKAKINQLNYMLDVTQDIAIDCINDNGRGEIND